MARSIYRWLVAGALAVTLAAPGSEQPAGYRSAVARDTVPPKNRLRDSMALSEALHLGFRGEAVGYLSQAGLPPVPGRLALGADGLAFRPAGGGEALPYPLYRERPDSEFGRLRVPSLELYGIQPAGTDSVYLFHLDGAVFETAAPGLFRLLVDHPEWLDSLPQRVPDPEATLVPRGDTLGAQQLVDSLAGSAYADSLYQLFGRPTRPIGLVGAHGQAVGRLGEYIGSRDSVSLLPDHMISLGQLRQGFTHELAHRWQRREHATLRKLWKGVPPITDSLRYGYREVREQQAEAVAFAVHFLQASARPDLTPNQRSALLDAHERLVPGTRVMTRYLLTKPLYRRHPLAGTRLAGSAAPRRRG